MKKYKIQDSIGQYLIFEDHGGYITPPKALPKNNLSVANSTKIKRAFSSTVKSVVEIPEEFYRRLYDL